MPSEDMKQPVAQNSEEATNVTASVSVEKDGISSEAVVEEDRTENLLKAKELYSRGSRHYLLKSFAEAADELSEVCALYGEHYGELSDELGMPYLLYAKSLIALALDENKVIDVPDEADDDDDDDDQDDEDGEGSDEAAGSKNCVAKTAPPANGKKLEVIKEEAVTSETDIAKTDVAEKMEVDSQVSSSDENVKKTKQEEDENKPTNGKSNGVEQMPLASFIDDGEKPSTSNKDGVSEDESGENEVASNLQLAWEILELAAKIFGRQGACGLSNLAEVKTELANIEFENNILDAARDDYEKAYAIYKGLPNNYRRAMAEIQYKIGLTYLMEHQNKKGADSLKEACNLIAGEVDEIKAKTELTDKDRSNIQDMEETKQEIEAKIMEIEEAQAQSAAEVRAVLDSYINPLSSGSSKSTTAATADGTTSSSSSVSSAAITSSAKPTDISHLIKRKKPEEPNSEAEAVSPAKRPAI